MNLPVLKSNAFGNERKTLQIPSADRKSAVGPDDAWGRDKFGRGARYTLRRRVVRAVPGSDKRISK